MIRSALFITAFLSTMLGAGNIHAGEACRLAHRGPGWKNAQFDFVSGRTASRAPAVGRSGRSQWCRELPQGFEIQSLHMHNGSLYAVLAGPASSTLAAATANGWLRSPGRGTAEISAILRFSVETGEITAGTYLTSEADDGSSAAFRVVSVESAGDQLRITSLNGWQPRMKNRIPMTCSGKPPFRTVTLLASDLSSAIDASAERCVCCE